VSWILPDDVRVKLQLAGDYKTLVLNDGPRAYWRLNETSGLSFADTTGNGNTGTISSATHYTLGVASAQPDTSKGLACDASQANIVFPTWATGTTWSFEVWIKITGAGPAPYSMIISVGAGGNGFYINPSTGKPNFFYSGSDHIFATALQVGTLYHLALVSNAGNVTLYINGQADANTFTAATSINVGSLLAGNGGAAVGASLVNDAALYAYALTSAQVAAHYRSGQWTDVTGDLTDEDLLLDYGIHSNRPEYRCADTGHFSFGLRNGFNNSGATVGYYSPYSAAKRPGFGFGIRTQLAITYSGTTIYWLGRLRTIQPQPDPYGEPVTHCIALDWMDEAATQNMVATLQQNARSDQVFSAAIAIVPFAPLRTTVDVGSDTYVYAFDNIWNQSKVLSALADLALSELGYIGQKRDTIVGQTVFFESRHTRPTINTLRVTLNKVMTGLDINGSSADILNHVRVTVHPRRTDSGATTVVAKLDASSGSPVFPGQSQTFFLNFTDSVQRDTFIGAKNVVTPLVATTDYMMNTAADGTGGDMTASFTITATVFASSIKIVVTNVGSGAGYVTKLQARGDGVYALNPIVGEAQQASSIASTGNNIADLDLVYQSDPTFAYNAAQYISRIYGVPLANVHAVTFCANQSTTLMSAAVFGEISDEVALIDTVNGLVSSQPFHINAVSLRISERNRIDCTWQLVPADTTRYWLLGTAGASELGSTTVIGL
jgi:hypothetical protein